jgi:hypothetical protein
MASFHAVEARRSGGGSGKTPAHVQPLASEGASDGQRDDEWEHEWAVNFGNTWQRKANVRAPLEWQRSRPIDFSFENPSHPGKFLQHPDVKQLLSTHRQTVKLASTSYCHYGEDYRKNTDIVTSVRIFQPTPPCCADIPCRWLQSERRHPAKVTDFGNIQRNSIPPKLIDCLVDAWMEWRKGDASSFLLIDVFAGFGSFHKHAAQRRARGGWQNLYVYTNDIVKRGQNGDFDMGGDSVWTLDTLLAFAIAKHWPGHLEGRAGETRMAWLQAKRIAVLFHCSTPCDTYSTLGLPRHRKPGSFEPKDGKDGDVARARDAMNTKLIDYFRPLLTPPRELYVRDCAERR